MQVPVIIEAGKSRVFASAIDWPGWSRGGRDEAGALASLLAYGPRYQRVLNSAGLAVPVPAALDEFQVAERVEGNATTDFGAPDIPPAADSQPLDRQGMERLLVILDACWNSLTVALEAAAGKELRKGPRGGGRDAGKLTEHVVEAHLGYLRRIAWRGPVPSSGGPGERFAAIKAATARALDFATSGEMPEHGPRGGALWKPRYFVRRAAWHILDHAWEIGDRIEP